MQLTQLLIAKDRTPIRITASESQMFLRCNVSFEFITSFNLTAVMMSIL